MTELSQQNEIVSRGEKCVFIAMLLYDMGAVSVFVVHSSDTLRYSHW